MRTLVALLFASLSFASVNVGGLAPDFALKDSNGKLVRLADFKNKFVVLEWLNYDCPFVKKHYGSNNMQSLQGRYTSPEKGVIWLSVISSAPGKQGYYEASEINALNRKKGGHATAILIDSDGKTGKAYGAKTTPHLFVVNPAGTIAYAGAIDSIPSVETEDIGKAINYVAEALDAAMQGKPIQTASTTPYGCSVKYR